MGSILERCFGSKAKALLAVRLYRAVSTQTDGWGGRLHALWGKHASLGSCSREQDTNGGHYAEKSGDHERMIIIALVRPDETRNGQRRSHLVRGHDPAEHEPGFLRPEGLPRKRYCRRHGRDPVETVADSPRRSL